AVVCVVHVKSVSSAHLVRAFLGLRQMNLLLTKDPAIRCEKMSRIEKLSSLNYGVCSCDDVQAVLSCQPLEQIFIVRSELGQAPHGSRRRRFAQIAEQLHGEALRKQRELAAILLRAAHQELHLRRKPVETSDSTPQLLTPSP